MSETSVTVRLTQRQDYQFDNQFGDGLPELLTDEPAPLGQGSDTSLRMTCGAKAAAVSQCSLSFTRTWLKAIAGIPSIAPSIAAATVPE